VSLLRSLISVLQETIPSLGWTGHLARSLQAEDQEIEHETVVLEHKGGELKTSDHTVGVYLKPGQLGCRWNWSCPLT
jgi:hypothetical protein